MRKFTTLLILMVGLQIKGFTQCNPSTSQAELNINNVRTTVLGAGDLWWNGVDEARYEFPKVDPSSGNPPKNIIFSGSLWISAYDDNDQIRVAGQSYRDGNDFWAGPITDGDATIAACSIYDRHWVLLKTTVDAHISSVNNNPLPLSIASISTDILEWPAKGNTYLVDDGYNITDDLAPFEDVNENDIYDPENGDYPKIKGDQSIFWVMNDVGNDHTHSNGYSLGVQVNCMAYAFQSDVDAVNNATFYDFEIVNKGNAGDLNNLLFSTFVDSDLGQYNDDYIGCDTTRNLAYTYNADNFDDVYGSDIPIAGVCLLRSPTNSPMHSFTFMMSTIDSEQGYPDFAPEFRNYQEGKWKNGENFTDGWGCIGLGNNSNFAYYDSPNLPQPAWSECSEGIAADDRRFLITNAPYDLPAGESINFTTAVIATMVENYEACPDIHSILGAVLDDIETERGEELDENAFTRNSDVSIGISKVTDSDFITLFPNPSTGKIIIEGIDVSTISSLVVFNLEGKTLVRKDSLTENHLDLSTLEDGIYFMQIISKNGQHLKSKKIILSR